MNIMKSKLLILVLILSILSIGCGETQSSKSDLSHYTVNKPDIKIELPTILHEVSGLTIIDDNTIACVQDEKGKVFLYNLETNSIDNQLEFGEDGDYEDIAKVGDTFYILRSDGTLFEFADYNTITPTTTVHVTNIPAEDNEGLYYDERNNRLLISTKSEIENNTKGIFSFDLTSKKLDNEPILTFDTDLLDSQIKANGIALNDNLKFKISALAIHPIEGNLYILSANEYLIFVFDMEGNLQEVAELDSKLYTKAEGIAFYDNGDMLISNEGENGTPSIMRVNYR